MRDYYARLQFGIILLLASAAYQTNCAAWFTQQTGTKYSRRILCQSIMDNFRYKPFNDGDTLHAVGLHDLQSRCMEAARAALQALGLRGFFRPRTFMDQAGTPNSVKNVGTGSDRPVIHNLFLLSKNGFVIGVPRQDIVGSDRVNDTWYLVIQASRVDANIVWQVVPADSTTPDSHILEREPLIRQDGPGKWKLLPPALQVSAVARATRSILQPEAASERSPGAA